MKHKYNVKVFQENNTANFWYLLGAFLTDGNVSHYRYQFKLQMTSKDTDWLELLSNLIGCPVYPTRDGHGNLTINSKEICSILIEHGCVPNKSLKVRFPTIPDEYLADFLRGCMDGDGSISITSGVQSYICSSSLGFIDDLDQKLTQHGFKHGKYEIQKSPYTLKSGKTITPKHKHYRITFNNNSAKTFLNWIYYPGHELAMPRKKCLIQKMNEADSTITKQQ